MGDLTSLETIHRMYISLTALMFNTVLCIMIGVKDHEDENRNTNFGILAFIVFFGNLVTCITSYVRHSDSVGMPPQYPYLAYLVSCMANILVTCYFARYITGYFKESNESSLKWIKANHIILIASGVSMAVFFLWKLPRFDGTSEAAAIEPWVKYVFGYSIELYFIIFTLIYFIRHRNLLRKRAFLTAVGGMILTVGGIILQLLLPGMLVNYVGATLGLFLFYLGVETPDYRKLMNTMSKLKDARVAADRANQSKSEFLANMSHEIRTPINAVLGMNEMIIRESDNETITSYARNVEASGRNLLSIINDILDFSKIEAGRMEIVPAEYHLSSLLNDVTNMVDFRARKKGLDFDIHVDEKIPDILYGDEVRIRQIMVNLLTNAVKYTADGGICLAMEGVIGDEIDEEGRKTLDLKISVADTGVGIKEEDIDKLFLYFERVDMQQNRTIEGTGLGLAITHDLALLMGGDIKVESVYGVGSTFTVNLPQKIINEEPMGDFKEKLKQDSAAAKKYHESFKAPGAEILVVDDTKLNLMVFKELLKNTELKIDTALSGPESIKMTMEKKYDCIFMDQRMPRMDGTQALGEIRRRQGNLNAETPVICLTADAVSGARERYIAEGFSDYLTKPVEGDRLEEMLIRFLPPAKVVIQ